MRILYLDLNIQYFNPTRNNIPLLLKSIGDLYTYGPGYQSESVLKEGIDAFCDIYGPFDIIATNEHLVFKQNAKNYLTKADIKAYKNKYYFQFSLDSIANSIKDMVNFFSKVLYSKKITFLLESDYYCFSDKQIEILENGEMYIVGWGKDFIAHTQMLEDLHREVFGGYANNNWFYFVQNYPKIIQTPHFVNSNEFYFECLENRKNTVYVPGTNYYHRKKTMKTLKESHVRIDNFKPYLKVYSLARKIGLRPDGNPTATRFYNLHFRKKLEDSKYIFTCGSGLEWPIRKFFEIPALGSLLLAKAFYGADKLGFIDGENYLETDHSNILEKISFLEVNKNIAQKISKSGQDMIWKNHSLHARASQIKSSLELILKGNFYETHWRNGEFYAQ